MALTTSSGSGGSGTGRHAAAPEGSAVGLHSTRNLSRKERRELYAPVKAGRRRKKARPEKPAGPGPMGWELVGGGKTLSVSAPPEFRGPTVQVTGLYPFSVGSSLALIGTPLGPHLEGRGMVCGDPVSWFVSNLINNPSAFVIGRPGNGKALDVETVVPTPDGYARMGDLQVGDYVYGSDGRATPIVAVSEVMTERECYELTFSTGERIVADAEHLWITQTRRDRAPRASTPVRAATGSAADFAALAAARRQLTPDSVGSVRTVTRALGWAGSGQEARVYAIAKTLPRSAEGGYSSSALLDALEGRLTRLRGDQRHKRSDPVKTTRQIADSLRCGGGRANHSIPVAGISGAELELPIAPYTLGAWLGDGTSDASTITGVDEEVFEQIRRDGYDVLPTAARMRYRVALRGETPRRGVGFRADLRRLGVLRNKHIPVAYLRASEPARRRLLAGLLDTDGTVARHQGSVIFTSTNERLAHDVQELACSLGYRASINERRARMNGLDLGPMWEVNFAPSEDVFGITRKSTLLSATRRPGGGGVRSSQRYIVEARVVDSRPVRCIQVANDDGVFLVGRSFIATHNSTLIRHVCGFLPAKGVLPIVLSDWKPDYVDLIGGVPGNPGLEGQVIKVGRSAGFVNPLDPGPLWHRLTELPDVVRAKVVANMRGRRMNVLEGLCALALGSDLVAHERTILSKAMELWDADHETEVPLIHDVRELIESRPERLRQYAQDRGDEGRYAERTQRLVDALMALDGGSETFGRVFAEPTTIELKLDRPVVFDLSEFDGMDATLQAGVQLVCWTYGSTAISGAAALADAGLAPRRSYLLVMDELWRALRAAAFMVDRVDEITRLNRTLNLGQVLCTHGMDDLKVHSEEATAKAWGFVARSEMVYLGGLNPGEMGNLEEVFALSAKEKDMLTGWAQSGEVNPVTGAVGVPRGRGKFLLKVGKKAGIPFMVDLVDVELDMHDTNRAWADTVASMRRSNATGLALEDETY